MSEDQRKTYIQPNLERVDPDRGRREKDEMIRRDIERREREDRERRDRDRNQGGFGKRGR